jgi:aryl-phospho-beta-D-glucosidase BglC (GH1 family)
MCVDRKYNLGVIVDLHAAPGSQNPWEHSSSRDGTQNWGTTDANIAQTVQVIEFLASRSARWISKLNSHGTDLHANLALHFTWIC